MKRSWSIVAVAIGALAVPAALAQEGACCMADGSCHVTSSVVCTTEGGVYQGDDSKCNPNTCADVCDNFSVCADSNGDTLVDFDDIDCFVAALVGPAEWATCGTAHLPVAYFCANDTNGDFLVNFEDIDGFVEALSDGKCKH